MDPNPFCDKGADSPPQSPSESVLRLWEQPMLEPLLMNPIQTTNYPPSAFDFLEEIHAIHPGPSHIPNQHGKDLSRSSFNLRTTQQQPCPYFNFSELHADINMDFNYRKTPDDIVNHEFDEPEEFCLTTAMNYENWDDYYLDGSLNFEHPFDQHLLLDDHWNDNFDRPMNRQSSTQPQIFTHSSFGASSSNVIELSESEPENPPEEENVCIEASKLEDTIQQSSLYLPYFPIDPSNPTVPAQYLVALAMPSNSVYIPEHEGVIDVNFVPYQIVNAPVPNQSKSKEMLISINEMEDLAGSSKMNLGSMKVEGGCVQSASSSNELLDPNKSLYQLETIPNVTEDDLTGLYGCTIPPLPQGCCNCRVIRRTMHTDGIVTKRLEIHGHPGFDFHAVGVLFNKNQPGGEKLKQRRVQLTSFPHARTILIDYLLKQFFSTLNVLVNDTTSELYTRLLKDSSPFPLHHYKTGKPLPQLDLNSGIELITLTVPTNNWITPTRSGGPLMPQNGFQSSFKITKSAMAMQRERTKHMTLENLYGYMHLRKSEAARRLAVCPTVLKKICKRNGLDRWPYRKIKAIDRTIATLYQSLELDGNLNRVRVMMQIKNLNMQKRAACRPSRLPPNHVVSVSSSGSSEED